MANDYSWPLPDGFPVGSKAVFIGTPVTDTTYPIFGINFLVKSPCDGESDIAYHTAMRYGAGYVVHNSFIVGKGWQNEERHQDIPIRGGKQFEITVVCESTHFAMYINGTHFSDFNHRMPIEKIKCLAVVASVRMSSITVGKMEFYSWPLKDNFPPSMTAQVEGTAGQAENKCSAADSFDVAFQTGFSCGGQHDVPFRMSVRYGLGLVLNNSFRIGYGWGQEESHTNLAVKKGEKFTMVIVSEKAGFKVYINGAYFCDFLHRNSQNKITHLIVRDNVELTSIKIGYPTIDIRTRDE